MEGNLNLGETRKQTESQVKGFVDEIRQKIQDKVSYFVHMMEMMHKFTIKNIVKLRVLPLTFLTSLKLKSINPLGNDIIQGSSKPIRRGVRGMTCSVIFLALLNFNDKNTVLRSNPRHLLTSTTRNSIPHRLER